MKKILIQFAHPAIARSRMNKALIKAVANLENVTVNDLYSLYPDFLIDVDKEQQLCEEHDVIIFQHPFYWYSTPSIMKEWLDLVLEHSWAFGKQATGLKDKIFLQAFTAGGDASIYRKDAHNEFSLRELTSPYSATARLCKMKCLPPFVILGIHRGLPDEVVNSHAEDYRRLVIALRDNLVDFKQAEKAECLNENLNTIIRIP